MMTKMKKILSHIAVLAAMVLSATACMDKVFPEGTEPTKAQPVGNIKIAISEVTDNSFKVSITPEGTPLFYSYLVAEGTPVELDAEKLYQGKYSDMAQAVVNFKEQSSVSFTVETAPNTDYTVYAVNSSSEGNLGEIVTASVKSTDGVNPAPKTYKNDANVLTLTFSENVEYVEGTEIEATIYASAVDSYLDVSQAMGKVKTTNVKVSGDAATITFKDLPTGCWYSVNVPAGAFLDEVGLPTPAINSSMSYDAAAKKVNKTGICCQIKSGVMEVKVPDVKVITNYAAYINIDCPQYIQQAFNATQLKEKEIDPVTYTVYHEEKDKTVETTYTLQTAPYYGATSMKTFGVRLSEKPAAGDYVSIHIPEGVWIDVFGNVNPEITIGPALFSFGYSIDDVAGVYTFNSTSLYASYGYGPYADVLTIEESDDEKAGDIMISGVLADADVKIYATFDKDFGIVSIKGGQKVGTVLDYVYDDNDEPVGTYEFDLTLNLTNGSSIYSNDIEFEMPAAHTLNFVYGTSIAIGLIETVNGSPYSLWDGLLLKKVEYTPDAKAETEATSSLKARKFNPVKGTETLAF